MAARIDLHTHSTASDGTTPPAELMRQAREAGLDVVALTDHDTTAGHHEAVQGVPLGLTLVRGAEVSCQHEGISLHLLAYLFDPDEPQLAAALAGLRASRVGRAEEMVRRLEADGVPISWGQVQALAGGTVGRPHIAQALMAAGLVGSVSQAFTPQWIGTGGRYWAPKAELDAVSAVGLVTAAGGVAVFAHPAAVTRDRTVGDDVVALLARAGLAGLEADHVDHSEPARAQLRRLAADLGLFVTGSSDFHGENKGVQLGAYTTSLPAYAQIVEQATGAVVVVG